MMVFLPHQALRPPPLPRLLPEAARPLFRHIVSQWKGEMAAAVLRSRLAEGRLSCSS